MLFGTAFYLMNMNRAHEESVITEITNFWVLDAFENQYELGLGEFKNDQFNKSDYAFLFYVLFFFATFFIQIVFLNMLIAIMGDTFDRVTEERFYNSRLTKLQIMADYVDFIDSGDEDEISDEEDSKSTNNSNPEQSRIYKMDSKYLQSTHFGIDGETENKKKYLYVVQLEDEITQDNSWDGQVSEIKAFTERVVTQCHNEMQRKVSRLYERVVESEARDGEREREVKSSLERVMHAMQTEIKHLKENQH